MPFIRYFLVYVMSALGVVLLLLSSQSQVNAETKFKPIQTQFIAASAGPDAKSGAGAETWGLWTVDPGPRGVSLKSYPRLVANESVAPAGWQFDAKDWWLEEHGLIMEAPAFGMPVGKYLVTGDRETKAVLTVFPKDAAGSQRWELSDGATIYDVTHLRCRAARYKPETANSSCTPEGARQSDFPMSPAIAMPEVNNCTKQDYAVLFVIGVEG
jgi:hypothetical protein